MQTECLKLLAAGFSKYSDLLSQSHVSSSPALADVLEKLIRMEVVKKEAPINDANNKRKAGYIITDNLSLFYYRYVFRYSSQMNVMDSDVFYDRYIRDDFEKQYVPRQFEEICRQYLIVKIVRESSRFRLTESESIITMIRRRGRTAMSIS